MMEKEKRMAKAVSVSNRAIALQPYEDLVLYLARVPFTAEWSATHHWNNVLAKTKSTSE